MTNGAVVTGGGGFLLEAFDNTFGPQATDVQLNASAGAILTGDATAGALSTADIDLAGASVWTGAALDISNVSTDATSLWNVTASSLIRADLVNNGTVNFLPPVGAFKTVTTQNYRGTGGILAINTFLGSDNSPSDQLVINGGTGTGLTGIRVTNAGGPGALTLADGIRVVDAIAGATTDPGAFVLDGRAVQPL